MGLFGISNSRDFHAKLEADFADLMKEPASPRLAINCAISAYQLHEWVWRDWLKKDRATREVLGITAKRESFLAWIDRACPWFPAIQELATSAKHSSTLSFETHRVSLLPAARKLPNAGAEDSHWDGPMPFLTGDTEVLLVDFGEQAGEHRWMVAAGLIHVVVCFWRDFFERYATAAVSEITPGAEVVS